MKFNERLAEFRADLYEDYVVVVEAGRFLAYMKTEHPQELAEWLETRALHLVVDALRKQERDARRAALHGAPQAQFAEAATAFVNEGEEAELRLFQRAFVINPLGVRRPLANMTAEDCRFVADDYTKSAKHSLARAAFFNELAKRIGSKTVSLAMDEEEVARLAHSLIGAHSHELEAAA